MVQGYARRGSGSMVVPLMRIRAGARRGSRNAGRAERRVKAECRRQHAAGIVCIRPVSNVTRTDELSTLEHSGEAVGVECSSVRARGEVADMARARESFLL